MSVEGMWKFQSGSAANPGVPVWGGIVVLETNRVFGGDSVQAYLGTYTTDRNTIRAEVRSWTWNTDLVGQGGETVFGLPIPSDLQVVLEGRIDDQAIEGVLYAVAAPEMKLAARMEKIAELPG